LAAVVALAALGIGAFYWTKVRAHHPVEISKPASSLPAKPELTAAPKPEPTAPAQPGPTAPPQPGPIARTPAPPVEVPALVIDNFSVEPQAVAQGKPALLKWSVKHAAEVRIAPDIGKVGATGARSVTPESSTTYKLTAKAANGPSKTDSVTLQVLAPPAIQDFSASRTSIRSGQSVVLKWAVTGAEQVSIDQGVGKVPLEGTHPVFPTVSKTYVLRATGPGGSVSQTVMVTVTYKGNPEIGQFSADPETINAGETAVLRWETINADEVTIDQGIGRVDAQGLLRVTPRATTTYNIAAASSRGTNKRHATVTVKR